MKPTSKVYLTLLLCFSAMTHSMESDRTQFKKQFYDDISAQSAINSKIQKLTLENEDQLITLVGNDNNSVQMSRSTICLSPTLENLLSATEKNNESLKNRLYFNNITGLQLQKIATILNNSVESYGSKQVMSDLNGQNNESETQYFSDDTIMKYLALHKELLTIDLYDIFSYFDLPLFKSVMIGVCNPNAYKPDFYSWSPDSRYLARAYKNEDKTERRIAHILDTKTKKNLRANVDLYNCTWSPDSQFVIVGDVLNKKRILHLSTNRTMRSELSYLLANPIWSPDEKFVIVGDNVQKRILDLFAKKVMLTRSSSFLANPIWSPNSNYIVIKNQSNSYIIKIIKQAENNLDFIVQLDIFSNFFCECSPDSQYFAYNSKDDNKIRLFLADKHSNSPDRPPIKDTKLSHLYGILRHGPAYQTYIQEIELPIENAKCIALTWHDDSLNFTAHIQEENSCSIFDEVYNLESNQWLNAIELTKKN